MVRSAKLRNDGVLALLCECGASHTLDEEPPVALCNYDLYQCLTCHAKYFNINPPLDDIEIVFGGMLLTSEMVMRMGKPLEYQHVD